ncbi:MAG: hypothetical protein AB1765_11740, partial [Candidatus Hydrogenedentota bacterium]
MLLSLFFFSVILLLASPLHATITDTWANIPKVLFGDFFPDSGTWQNYPITMTGPDTEGRWNVTLQLSPGAYFEYKFAALINNDTKWEPNFATASGNREITIEDDGTGKMVVYHNFADTPSVPSGVIAQPGNQMVILTWSSPADNSRWDVQYGGGYNIYISTTAAGPPWTKVNTDTIFADTDGTQSYTITGLVNDSSYYFVLECFDAYFDTWGPLYSGYSDIKSATPSLPVLVYFRVDIGPIVPGAGMFLAGTFNSWSRTDSPMTQIATGLWEETVYLQPYWTYEYKYVLDGAETGWEPNYKHLFQYYDPLAESVAVCGEFNSWNLSSAVLMRRDNSGTWSAEVELSSTQDEYKFVINGEFEAGNNRVVSNPNTNRVIVPTYYIGDTVLDDWACGPDPPQNFTAISYDTNSIYLEWELPSYPDRLDHYQYNLYRLKESTDTLFTLIDTLPVSTLNYLDTGLITGETYYYVITSLDTGYIELEGNISNVVTAVPRIPVPVYFYVDIGPTDPDTLAWASEVNNWSTSADTMQKVSTSVWRIMKMLQPGNTYEYKYVMDNGNLWEQDYKVKFEYNDSTCWKVEVAGEFNGWDTANAYLLRKESGTDTWVTEVSATTGQGYKYLINGVYEGGSNRTVSYGGSNRSVTISMNGDTFYDDWSGLPDTPAGIQATGAGDTSILLTWYFTDNKDTYDHYKVRIYRSSDTVYIDSGYQLIAELPYDTISFIDSGLNYGETYYYRFTVIDTGSIVQEGAFSKRITGIPYTPVSVIFYVDIGFRTPDTVALAGQFNNWSPSANIMDKIETGLYVETILLQPGLSYEYKYVMKIWEQDYKVKF